MAESKRGPIKVKVHDKRRTGDRASKGAAAETHAADRSPAETHASSSRPAEGAAPSEPIPSSDASSEARASSVSSSPVSSPGPGSASVASQPKEDFEDLYLRAVADLDNERKRFKMREREQADRAVRALIESLLPVLDNFERAISHGEGGEGVALVFKEFKAVLEREGLEEIPANGVEFDPNVHEAVESRVTPGLEVPTVIEVYRRGYMLNGQVLRAAMVVVGRPEEPEEAIEQE